MMENKTINELYIDGLKNRREYLRVQLIDASSILTWRLSGGPATALSLDGWKSEIENIDKYIEEAVNGK